MSDADREQQEITEELAMQNIGKIGVDRTGGIIDSDFVDELEGSRRLRTLKEMVTNDSTISAVLFAIDRLMTQVDWHVRPASSDPQDMDAAEFLRECLEDMSHTVKETVSMTNARLGFGFAPLEQVYKRRDGEDSQFSDGRIGWRRMGLRKPETLYQWEFTPEGELDAMIQQDPASFQYHRIPAQKLLLFTFSGSVEGGAGSPEGQPMIRGAYRDWYYKKRVEELQAIAIERDATGVPMAWAPAELWSDDASADQKAILDRLQEVVKNIRRNESEGLVFPLQYDEEGNKRYDFELIESGGDRQIDVNDTIKQYQDSILRSLLADFLLLGSTDQVGSFAMSRDRSNLFLLSVESLLDDVENKFNKKAIPQLFSLNPDFDQNVHPKIEHDDIRKTDAEKVGGVLRDIANAGATPFANDEQNQLLNSILRLLNQPTVEEQIATPVGEPNEPPVDNNPTEPGAGVDG